LAIAFPRRGVLRRFLAVGDSLAGQSQRQKEPAGDQAQNHRRFKLAGGQQIVFVRHYPQSEPDRYPAQYRENKFNERIHKIEL